MQDDYASTLERLYGLVRFGERLGLEGPRALDLALGGPVGRVPAVLIGGTNGKGSTAAFVEALLRGRGLRTGLFTSPHLMSFRERIRIDGVDLEPERVVALADRVLSVVEKMRPGGGEVPFFEVVWAMAALAFAESGVDWAIWEVGLGGRLDATNVCDPRASAVVTLGLDHTAVLGPDLASIAREKAPIFRPGRPALTGTTGLERALLASACAPGVELAGFDTGEPLPMLPLPGAHQRENAELAMALVRSLGLEPDAADLQNARWPGRGEEIRPGLFLDCAHNPHGAEALARWLSAKGDGRPVDLIVGVMADKDASGVLAALQPVARRLTLVSPGHPRALSASELAARVDPGGRTAVCDDVGRALDARDPAAMTVLCGSCYLVGEARARLLGVRYPEAGLSTVAR